MVHPGTGQCCCPRSPIMLPVRSSHLSAAPVSPNTASQVSLTSLTLSAGSWRLLNPLGFPPGNGSKSLQLLTKLPQPLEGQNLALPKGPEFQCHIPHWGPFPAPQEPSKPGCSSATGATCCPKCWPCYKAITELLSC